MDLGDVDINWKSVSYLSILSGVHAEYEIENVKAVSCDLTSVMLNYQKGRKMCV